jgi:hypothetical protein
VVLPSSPELQAAEVLHRRRELQRLAMPRRSHRARIWLGTALVRAGLVLARPGWDARRAALSRSGDW